MIGGVHTSGQRIVIDDQNEQQDILQTVQYEIPNQNLISELFLDTNLATVASFYQKNKIIINPTAFWNILNQINKYESQYQIEFLAQIKEILIRVQTNSTLLLQKNEKGEQYHSKNILDELIEMVLKSSNQGQEQVKKEVLTIIQVMMKYNNISKQNLQNLFSKVTEHFYSGFIEGNLILTSLDILHNIFNQQMPITSEPHNFFYFNGLRSGIEVVKSQWTFSKGVTFCFWVYPQDLDEDRSIKLKQQILYVQCEKKEFEFFVNEHAQLFYQYTDKQDKKEPVYIIDLNVMHWQFLVIQISLVKSHFASDKYQVNIIHDNEKVSMVAIDFPKIKAGQQIDKMAFFRNFIGRCSSILVFRGGSQESDNIKSYQDLYKNYKYGIETEHQLADFSKTIGPLYNKKEMFYLPMRSGKKYVYEMCFEQTAILSTNSGVFCKESNFMCLQHFCGLNSLIPFFYLMRFCSSKKRQDILNSAFSLINTLFKQEKFKCQEEAFNLNFFLVLSQMMNETNLKYISKQTIEHIAEIRQNIGSNLKQEMFSKFIWNINLVNVEDAEVFELFYKFVQAIYIEDFNHHSKLFSISDIIEFIIEKVEPKNQMCCLEHFPKEENNVLSLNKNQSSTCSNDFSNSLALQSHQSSKQLKFITKYDKKLSILMNLIEKVLYTSKGNLAADIYHLIKCLTLNLTPCFYKNLLKLLINIIQQDDKDKRVFLKKFFEYQGIYSVLFTLSRCTCPVVKTLCVKLISEIARMEYVQMNSSNLFKGMFDYENELGALISYSLQFTFLSERPQGYKGVKLYEDFEIIDDFDVQEPQILIQNNHFDVFKNNNNDQIKELEDSHASSFEVQKANVDEIGTTEVKQSSQNLKTVYTDELQSSEILDIKDQNKQVTEIKKKTEQSIKSQDNNKNSQINNNKIEESVGSPSQQIHFHPLYVSIIEWVLNKEASPQLKEMIIVEDQDQIQSIEAFLLLIQFFDLCDEVLQQDIIVDIYFLIKHNPKNRQIFIESKEFQHWVVKILFRSLCEQIQSKLNQNNQDIKIFENQWNMAIKIISRSYSHGLTNMSNFGENLNELVGLIKNVTNNTTVYQFQIVECVGKLLLRLIFQSILENIFDDIKNQGEFSKTHLQKNMKWFINLTFSFIFSESYLITNPPFEFDFYNVNSKHFTFLEENYLNLPAFPRTFGTCLWVDAPLIFKIMESYSNLFTKYCINNDLLLSFFAPEQSLHMDNLFQILFDKQQNIVGSTHVYRKSSNNGMSENDVFGQIQNGLIQSQTFQNKMIQFDEEYCFVQQLFFIVSSLGEFLIKSFQCSEEQLKTVFLFLENMIKVSSICCENSREVKKTEEQKEQIKLFFLFSLSFYYNMYRYLQREGNQMIGMIEESIHNIMQILFFVMDKTCKYKDYQKLLINIFQENLFDQNNKPLLTEEIITKFTFDNMNELDQLIFTDEWQYAFIENCNHKFPDSTKIRVQFEFVRNQECFNIQDEFEKVMKKRKEIRTNFDYEKYNIISVNNSKDQQRKTYFLDKEERIVRQAKYVWYNIWKKNRSYRGLWKHPNFKAQIDQKFSPEIYDYQKMEKPSLFYYKMSKYMTKQKVRPLLKLKLVEPKYVVEFEKNKLDKQLQRRKLGLLQYDLNNTHQGPQSPSNYQSPQPNKEKKSGGFNLLKQIKNLYQVKNTKEEVEWFTVKCQWIKSLTIRIGMVKIDSQNISFYFDTIEQKETHLSMVNHSIPDNRPLSKSWPLHMVKYYMRKRFVHRKTAIEFYLYDGSTVLFNFPDRDLDAVIEKLQQIRKKELQNKPNFGLVEKHRVLDKQKQIKKWISRQKSNLDYLMTLNFFAGRSYRDLTQYPVMPWIWVKFDNQTINLNDQTLYRNFSKTMGALGSAERTEQFRQKLETTDHFNPVPPYNFGTHYSSPAIIFQFLLRIKPYNTGAWYLQAQRFDIPDRLFFSLFETFKNVTEEMSDVRELIPEFYYLPELFLNLEKHDFGIMQSKERVHNVVLPPWCNQDPYLFIYNHRLSLEGEIVSRNIHQWIDLIFGYKSRGKEAEQSLNKFYYLTYEDEFNIDEVKDEKERIGYESQIIHFGQCPAQLLTTPHPSRIQNQSNTQHNNSSIVSNNPSSQSVQPSSQTLIQTSYNHSGSPPINSQSYPYPVALNQQLFVDKSAQLQFFRAFPKEQKEGQSPDSYRYCDLRNRSIIQIYQAEVSKFLALRKNGEVSVIKLQQAVDEKYYPFKQNVVSDRQLELDLNKNEKIHNLDQSCQFRVPPTIFLNQGKYLLTGGLWGGRICLYSTESEKLIKEFKHIHNWTVTAMDFDHKSYTLATGSKAGDVCMIKMSSDYQNFIELEQYYDHKGEVTNIHINYEFRCMATASIDGNIFIYNIFNKKLHRQFNHPKGLPVHKVCITARPLYAIIFFSERDCTFYSYSINGQLLATYNEDSTSILNPLIIQDSSLLDQLVYINYQNQKLKILEAPYLKERSSISKPLDVPNAVWWQPSQDKKFIICGSEDGNVFFIIDPKGLEAIVYKALNQFV
ncbi:hypothetical protein ABPG74_008535 [Tetrahymena malaccensis]